MRIEQKHDRDDCPAYADHWFADQLREIDRLLDEIPEVVALVYDDLIEAEGVEPDWGREGMTARQVLGATVAYHVSGVSYEKLAFLLKDSASFQCLCRIPDAEKAPSSSTLQDNISKVTSETWQTIQTILVRYADAENIEDGRQLRGDCTVCETDIHPPTDISLCRDVVRVGSRLLDEAADHIELDYSDHTLRATRRMLEFHNASGPKRREVCRDLLRVTRWTLGYVESAIQRLEELSSSRCPLPERRRAQLVAKLSTVAKRGRAIIDQTWRRLLKGEKVPAADKIVSLFEAHTDIIVTNEGEVQFGHKVVLTTGTSSMVLDAIVLDGNPADSTLTERLIERHEATYGHTPDRVAFDGGFASRPNLEALQNDHDIQEVAFHKKRGLSEAEMTSSRAEYRQLRAFRAGIEGNISWLKHTFMLRQCRWRSGLEGFKAYVHSAVVSANLLKMARHRLERRPG